MLFFSLVLFSEFVQVAINYCTWRSNQIWLGSRDVGETFYSGGSNFVIDSVLSLKFDVEVNMKVWGKRLPQTWPEGLSVAPPDGDLLARCLILRHLQWKWRWKSTLLWCEVYFMDVIYLFDELTILTIKSQWANGYDGPRPISFLIFTGRFLQSFRGWNEWPIPTCLESSWQSSTSWWWSNTLGQPWPGRDPDQGWGD